MPAVDAFTRWSFFAVGLLFVGLGVPLALGMVPPNHTYGFRVAKTLANVDAWYAANRASGIGMVVGGLVVCAATFAIGSYLRKHSSSSTVALLAAAFMFVVMILGSVVPGVLALRQF